MYNMPQKMKGGFHGIRSKQISLVLIVLVCITLLIWGCERTSLLSPFLQQYDQILEINQGMLWRFSLFSTAFFGWQFPFLFIFIYTSLFKSQS